MRRNELDVTSQAVRNILTNPALETASATKDLTIRTNMVSNPGMRTASTTPTITRTNLITNPSMSASGAISAIRTNLCTNPGAEATTSNVAVRTNLTMSPRGVSAITGYGTQTITPNVSISNHPMGFTTALRVSYLGGTSNPGVQVLDAPESGVTYYMSAWIYHETVGGGSQAFAQAGVASMPSPPAIVQGVWQKISWTRLTSGTSALGFRVSGQTGDGSFLITGMQVEKSTIAMPYFDALTTTLNLTPNPSMDASTGATTVRTNYCPNPKPASISGYVGMTPSLTTFSNGAAAVQSNGNGVNTAYLFSPNSTASVAVGETVALSALVEFSPGIRYVNIRANRRSTNEYFTSGQSIAYDPAGKGVHRISVLFTSPSAIAANDLSLSLNFFDIGGAVASSGSWARMGQVLIEKVGSILPYFDGSTSATTDFTFSWLGTTDNSASVQRGTNVSSWGAQWYGNGGGAGYFYRATGAGISGGYSARKVWTSDNTTNSLDVGITTTINVIPNATYTSSIYQKSSFASVLTCYVVWKDSGGATISTTPRTAYTNTPAGSWVRGSCTETAPANAATGTFIFGPYTNSGTISAGSTIDWDWCLIEESDKVNPYYDGSVEAPNEFNYLWNGAAHNATSLQRAAYPSGFGNNTTGTKLWQTPSISYHGSKSVAVEGTTGSGFSNGVNFTVNNLPAGTYTFSVYVNLLTSFGTSGVAACIGSTAGVSRGNNVTTVGTWQRTSVTATVPSTQNVWFYVITDGTSVAPAGARFYADAFLVEATSEVRPYFDGTNNTLNLLPNPSFEVNTTGWLQAGMGGATISRDVAPVYSGTGSMRVACDGTSVNQGAFTSTRTQVKPNRWYTASIWVKSNEVGRTLRLELGEWDDGGNLIGSRQQSSTVTSTGDWQRFVVSKLMGPTASSVDIVMRNVNAANTTMWLDAALLEEGTTASDFPNASFSYAWTGTTNASTSEQRATTVSGITYQGPYSPYQSAERSIYGTSSLYLEGASGDAAYNTFAGPTVSGLTVGTTYTLSAWIYVMPGSVGVELQPSGVGSAVSGRSTTTGRWERVYQTFTAAATSHILRVRTTTNGKAQVYIGAMLLEQGATLLPYFDAANPAVENIAGTTIAQSAGGTITSNVSYNGYIWSRAATPTGSSALLFRNIVNANKLIPGQPYTVSVTVANDQTSSVYVSLDWCDNNTVGYTLAPGETKTLTTTGVGLPSRGYDAVYRFADLNVSQSATEPKSVLFKDWLIEFGSTTNNYYSGTGDYTYTWSGTANASTSNQRVFPVLNTQAGRSNADLNSRFWTLQSTDETGRKVARFLSPAGTPNSSWRVVMVNGFDYANIQAGKAYTLYIKYRTGGWGPSASPVNVQLSDGTNLNQVMTPDTNYRVSLSSALSPWQTYRRVFTAAISASASTYLYIPLPSTPEVSTDGIFEISELLLVDNSYSGAYFDGSTVSTDPDFSYSWTGTVDGSNSRMLGASITGTGNTVTHGQGVVSTVWKSSGTKSVRIVAKNVSNNDSFVDINGMIPSNTFKPNTKYTLAGTRYISSPLTGTIFSSPGYRVNIGGDRSLTYKAGYTVNNAVSGASRVVANFTTGSDTTFNFVRLMNGSAENNGDVWWDDLMLVEGDYDGRHVDGTMPNAKWDGTAHASTSVGYPTTLESLVGMPLVYATSASTTNTLNTAQLTDTSARTFYSVVDAPLDLVNGAVDAFWTYGKTGLSDSPANTTITFRYQSEPNAFNSILARRTGGGGAVVTGVPTPGRYIMFCGLNSNMNLFAGHGGNPANVTTDPFVMPSVPHEQLRIEPNNQYHTHVATYVYAGLHDTATRALVIKLLAQRHNVPALV